MNPRTWLALIVPILLCGLHPTVAVAAPWVATGATTRGDFDNDGSLEIVASSPETDGNKGAVDVVDRTTGSATRWTRDTSGLLRLLRPLGPVAYYRFRR